MKTRVCIICGGQSTEHRISLISGSSVLKAIDRRKYDVILCCITEDGQWLHFDKKKFLVKENDPDHVRIADGGKFCFPARSANGPAIIFPEDGTIMPFDIAFPVLHGPHGEDGTIQGLFEMIGAPYVGCGVMASANCMDKATCKTILDKAGIQTAKAVVLRSGDDWDTDEIFQALGSPVFVKPANAGSSIGISKAKDAKSLAIALECAFKYDSKVLVEEAIVGREIECGVLGNGSDLFCAQPGEVIPHCEFYSYEAKYISENGATVTPEAKLTRKQVAEVQALAKKAYMALDCAGMSRVDFFLSKERGWVLNELNTIPGFTSISLYPKMMELAGIGYSELIDRLLKLAAERAK